MVLKKMLNKFRSKNEQKKSSEEPNNSNSSKEQKKLKKIRSVKVSDKGPKKTTHLQQVAAEVPNYMKSTTSNEARKEKIKVTTDSSKPTNTTYKPFSAARALVKNSSLKLLRSSIKKNKRNTLQSSVYTSRAICSSNIKDSETPEPVNLNENHDISALKTCNYSYCSLHGHKHGDVPSLKRFLSGRRRQSVKVQRSIKLRDCSSIKKGGVEIELVEDVVNELFIEIHSKLQEQNEERSRDEAEIINTVSRMNEVKLQESYSVTSIEDCGDNTSELSMEDINVINQFLELIKEGCQEETQFETAKTEQGDSEVKLSRFLLSKHDNCNETANHKVSSQTQTDDERPQNTIFVNETGCGKREENISEANLNSFPVENNVKKCSSLASRSKVKYSKLRRQRTKSKESVKVFNPRPPRSLALKAESEQEKVDLKHQNVDERKAAEEWMIDYALRKALRRLASARKRKVPLLVAAFETVMP